MNDIFAQVKQAIIDQLGAEESKVTPEARFREDLGADSLDLVELIMRFEEKLGETIPDEDARELTTVGKAVEYLEKRLAKK